MATETGCESGSPEVPTIAGHELARYHADVRKINSRTSPKYERKFSQTFTRRPSPEWKPAVRRYSVETGQLVHQRPYATAQHIDSAPEHKIDFATNLRLQEYSRGQLSRSIDRASGKQCCSCHSTRQVEPTTDDLATSNDHDQYRDGSVRGVCRSERAHDGCEKEVASGSEGAKLNPVGVDEPNSEGSGTQSTKSESKVTDQATGQGCDDVLRHGESSATHADTASDTSDKSKAVAGRQNKLTSMASNTMCPVAVAAAAAAAAAESSGSSVPTCCANVSAEKRTPATRSHGSEQHHQQPAHAATKLAHDRRSLVAGASLESDDALATVSMNEKMQLQDKQRKHVILSMALKHLITPERRQQQQQQHKDLSTGPSSPRSVEQTTTTSTSCGDFRSRSCSFGPARSKSTSPNVSMVLEGIAADKTATAAVNSDAERWRISENTAESHTSVFFVSSNLHQVFDWRQKQRLDHLAKRQFIARTKKQTLDEICQIKLQAYKQQQAYLRQIQSKPSSGTNTPIASSSAATNHSTTIANDSAMRQLVTDRLDESSWRDQPSPSDGMDSFELATRDRPKSMVADNVDSGQGERTPARRARGPPRSRINCDSLYSGLAANQSESNLEALIVESWLDDHPNFTHDYFMRKAPHQMIDDWLVANAKVSNTNLSSQLDLRSLSSISRPLSQLSLSSQLRGACGVPSWKGSQSIAYDDIDQQQQQLQAPHDSNTSNSHSSHGCIRPARSNSQSAAGLTGSRTLAGSLTPIRKISATDFETRSGSGFLRPMLSKTPDGRLTFLPQTTSCAENNVTNVQSVATKMGCVPEADTTPGHVSTTSDDHQSKSTAAAGTGVRVQPRAHEPAAASACKPTIEFGDDLRDGAQAECARASGEHTAAAAAHDEGEVPMIFELVKNIYDDLDIRTLFHKILKNIAVLINADRSSLFLVCGGPHDPNRRLVSQLFNVDQESLEICDMESITIPWGVGLMGYVAKSGESVNIASCYEDPRFTDAIDQRTGYITRNMLCAPIFDKHNEIVGVAQVINKRDGNSFSKNDELKFKRYLQFCGIGLRNAQSYEQCQLENRRNQVLLDLARMVFEEQSTIEQVVHRIMLHTQSLLDCERCQVLLIDNGNDELDSLLQMRHQASTSTTYCSSNTQEEQPNCNKQTAEWQPQCSRQLQDKSSAAPDEPGIAAAAYESEQASGASEDDLVQQRIELQRQKQPPPRLFSLVFDLECAGYDDPVVYETRGGGGGGGDADVDNSPARGGTDTGEPNQKNRAFPINIGITGYVATTGETLNIENAHEHERFDSSVDESSDFRHKSILCTPIRNGQRQIIGVIQLVNKKNGQPFNKNDEDLFEAFAIFCGLGIHNTLMYERVLKVMAKQRVTFEVLSYHATAPLEDARKLSQGQVPSCFALNLASLKFNDFSLDEHYMLKSCLRFFLDLDLMRRFQIDRLVFCNWILSVQKNYRKVNYHPVVGGDGLEASPVRYHNWRHAFNVGQMMFAILVNTQICRSLGELETLALLIACLCHDLDHRGTNNSFQIKSASPLAELYSTSTMEHHHFDQCVMILNSQGNQILANLSPEEYSRVIMLLEEAILATDLANYFQKRDHFFQLVNSGRFDWRSDPDHRSILRCMLMTACDIGAITKPWPVQKTVADLVMSEFYQQGDIEKNELKIEPIDMMNREKMSELPSMQMSFIDTICAPIYTAFAKLFPQELDTLLDGCLTNRSLWREISESNSNPEIPLISYLDCDTSKVSPPCTSDRTHDRQESGADVRVSKSETNISRKLSLCAGDNAWITNKKKLSLSGSFDPLAMLYDLHDQASQETMIPSGSRCDDNYDSCDSEPIELPPSTSLVGPENHRHSL